MHAHISLVQVMTEDANLFSQQTPTCYKYSGYEVVSHGL